MASVCKRAISGGHRTLLWGVRPPADLPDVFPAAGSDGIRPDRARAFLSASRT